MKKIIISLMSAMLCATSLFAKSNVEIKTVSGPNKETVEAFTHTYSYPYKSIEAAIKERFASEGLKAKKFKNKFWGYKEVKYNHLSGNVLDLYFSVNGSNKAGTVNLLLSHGYSNYYDVNDYETRRNVSDWFDQVDVDIQNYMINQEIEKETKDLKKTENELKKLKNQNKSLEKQIDKNTDKIKAHKATSTMHSSNAQNVDPNQLAKDQKTAQKLSDTDTKLRNKHEANAAKIEKAKEAVKEHEANIKKLKESKIK